MKKYYTAGAWSLMILGILHLIAHFMRDASASAEALHTMEVMRDTPVRLMGEHNIMKFYDGFSLATGVLIFCVGLVALMNRRPDKRALTASVITTVLGTVISALYFHPLAYGFFGLSAVCFIISLMKYKNDAAPA